MTSEEAKTFAAKYKWPIAAVLVIVAGYSVGKDMAFRDNARDVAETHAELPS